MPDPHPSRQQVIEDFQQSAMAEAHEQFLFQEMCASKAYAETTGELVDYRHAAQAYVRYLRSHLTDPERDVLRLEDEVIRLRAKNQVLKERLGHGR